MSGYRVIHADRRVAQRDLIERIQRRPVEDGSLPGEIRSETEREMIRRYTSRSPIRDLLQLLLIFLALTALALFLISKALG
ncbi:MAG: hypothetical protein AAF401_10440 [Pseudomonadota bacterium]